MDRRGTAEITAPLTQPVLSVTGLRKRYGRSLALDGADFGVAPGEVLGLLGPNGAGKTTALECIAGLVPPDEGTILLEGEPIGRGARRRIGIALQGPTLQDQITPRETLGLFASLYGVQPDIDALLSSAGLANKRDARFSTLSGGEKQRLNLALAQLNDPLLLLLDEPTTGLDPASRSELLGTIRALAAEGRAVLLTTHDLDEAEQICDRLAVLDKGRVIASGAPSELVAGGSSLTVIEGEASVALTPQPDDGLEGLQCDGRRFRLRTADPTRAVALLTERIQRRNGALISMRVGQSRLEDVLLDLLHRRPGA